MLNIAIVDDENSVCSYVEKCLIDLSKKYGISIETDVFFSGEDLTKTIKNIFYDVIFLDIIVNDIIKILIMKKIKGT